MNNGIKYEQLTQQVYQILLMVEWPGKNICVRHDVNLLGKSGVKHQIDVYWEYELAGVKNKVAIECKDYRNPISIGKVRDFYGVLDDLKDVKGIMVAARGFQKGAQEYAKANGINLKELTVSDEVPVIADIVNYTHFGARRVLFKIDEEWAKEKGLNIDSYRKRMTMWIMDRDEWPFETHLPIPTTDSNIVNGKGKKISSIGELESTIYNQIVDGQEFVFPFDDAYINSYSGPIKITEVLIKDKYKVQSNTFRIVAEDCVKAILKDASDGNIQNILCPKNV